MFQHVLVSKLFTRDVTRLSIAFITKFVKPFYHLVKVIVLTCCFLCFPIENNTLNIYEFLVGMFVSLLFLFTQEEAIGIVENDRSFAVKTM